jgi:hypothetical protein
MDVEARQQAYERARPRARHIVYERLALVSTAIWVLGTLFLFLGFVPVTARPGPQIMVSMLIPLVPAALPWLFYGAISDRLARRWAQQELAQRGAD